MTVVMLESRLARCVHYVEKVAGLVCSSWEFMEWVNGQL